MIMDYRVAVDTGCWPSVREMEATYSSEIVVSTDKATRPYNP
jgi:hypothetical protein